MEHQRLHLIICYELTTLFPNQNQSCRDSRSCVERTDKNTVFIHKQRKIKKRAQTQNIFPHRYVCC